MIQPIRPQAATGIPQRQIAQARAPREVASGLAAAVQNTPQALTGQQ